MFKLPNPPSPGAAVREVADYLEYLAWKQKSVSEEEMKGILGQLSDNEYNEGCDDSDEPIEQLTEDAFREIERRKHSCANGYPFAINISGTVLRHLPKMTSTQNVAYRYLLLATRMDMAKSRKHDEIDGTLLFEELSECALKNYLGPSRARSIRFGTSSTGSGFAARLNNLCKELGEGGGYRRQIGAEFKKDGGLDIVCWLPFADLRPAKLSIFAQCKTGTTWSEQVTHLDPGAFAKRWLEFPFPVTPVKAFCISEALDEPAWVESQYNSGILFDRCRIVECSRDLPKNVVRKMKRWSSAAFAAI